MKKYLFTIILLATAVAATVVYLLFDPAQSALFPRCPFLVITGFKCPGCGSQRVIHSLLSGDIAAAWHYNAFMVAALPVIALYSYAELRRPNHPQLYNRLNSPAIIWSIFAATVLWWLLRNIFAW